MATEILIPKLGMTMTEGTVAEWHIPDGGEVKAGESIYRLETEKIEFEVEAEADGIVRHLVAAGTTLEPGAVVGYLLAVGEVLPAGVAAPVAGAREAVAGFAPTSASASAAPVTLEGGRVPSSPIARRLAKEFGLDLAAVAGSGPNGRITESDVVAARAAAARPAAAPVAPPTVPAAQPSREVIASPLARKLAETLGVDLRSVVGTGPGGRITKEDVDAAASAPLARPAPAPVSADGARRAPGEIIPMRAMRRTIAERMHRSLQEMAQLTMGMDVTMVEAEKLRTQLIAEWEPEGVRPSYTDLILVAVAKALRLHPGMNATITDRGIELLPEVHVAMAVALDEGLVVPVIRNTNELSLKQLAQQTPGIAAGARAGSLSMDDMTGGTFSVTSLGMAGVDFFTPVINPPNVGILGVGRVRDGVAWDGDRPVRTRLMTLSLTIDHRAVDGAPGAAFLNTVRELLEAPYRLLV